MGSPVFPSLQKLTFYLNFVKLLISVYSVPNLCSSARRARHLK